MFFAPPDPDCFPKFRFPCSFGKFEFLGFFPCVAVNPYHTVSTLTTDRRFHLFFFIFVMFLCCRGADGIAAIRQTQNGNEANGQNTWEKDNKEFPQETAKNCKVMSFSPMGNLFAYSTGDEVKVLECPAQGKWSLKHKLDQSRVSFLTFSPAGSLLATWEVFNSKTTSENNLHLWDCETGAKVASFVQKKAHFWKPQWSKDEKICAIRSPNNEVHFYKDNNFKEVDKRFSLAKLDSFSISPNSTKGYHLVGFVPGQKGGPGFGKLFTYPNFNPERDTVANKSFFQADRMDTEWSGCGTMVLLLTQSEVDKTGGSYYGKQQLHFMSATGDTAMVQLAKEGPIYSIQWNPVKPQFCVVYGYMPAKATLYNAKCEKVFDFGTGARNTALFNPQGNLLLLGGFGNLRGNIEVWSLADKKEVSKFEAPDSTDIRWSSNGQYLMTSTCAPRLRQGNGLKIWHYTSSLQFEMPFNELWEVAWQNDPKSAIEFKIQYSPVKGIAPKQPVASKQAYVPPSLRNKGPSKFKLHDDDEPAENAKKSGGSESMSKAAAKNKKRKEARNRKKEEEKMNEGRPNPQSNSVEPQKEEIVSTTDPVKAKKIMRLNEKLQQIQQLKAKRDQGKQLEINQLEKIKKEGDIIKEIEALRL